MKINVWKVFVLVIIVLLVSACGPTDYPDQPLEVFPDGTSGMGFLDEVRDGDGFLVGPVYPVVLIEEVTNNFSVDLDCDLSQPQSVTLAGKNYLKIVYPGTGETIHCEVKLVCKDQVDCPEVKKVEVTHIIDKP